MTIERHLDEELIKLKSELLRMAAMSESAIHRSIEALKDRNKELAELVIEEDEKIDETEIVIDDLCIEILALFQPMAKDLRFITTAMHINADLEEIADLCVNISKRTKEISNQPVIKPLHDIPKLGEIAKWMVKSAIDAFVARDEELAKRVILTDTDANALRNALMKELVYEYIVKDATIAPHAISLILVARDLERICDHAASIAEDVIYMIQAKVIRHHRERLLSTDSPSQ